MDTTRCHLACSEAYLYPPSQDLFKALLCMLNHSSSGTSMRCGMAG